MITLAVFGISAFTGASVPGLLYLGTFLIDYYILECIHQAIRKS